MLKGLTFDSGPWNPSWIKVGSLFNVITVIGVKLP